MLSRETIMQNMIEGLDKVFWVKEGHVSLEDMQELICLNVLGRYVADNMTGEYWAGLARCFEVFSMYAEIYSGIQDVRLLRDRGGSITCSEYVQEAGKAIYSYMQMQGVVPNAAACEQTKEQLMREALRARMKVISSLPRAP